MTDTALLQTGLYGAGLALVGCVLFVITARAPRVLLTLFLAQITLTSGAIGFYPSAVVGGVHIYLGDIFTALLVTVGVVRKLQQRNWLRQDTIFTTFALIVLVGFLSYIPQFSIQSSVNHSRALFLSIGAYFWASSLGKWDEALLAPFVWAALLGATVQNFLYLKNGFGSASEGYWDEALGGWVSARPLQSSGALIMLCGLLVILSRSGAWNGTRVALTTYLAVSVVLSQHRSVWVAALIAITVLAALAIRGSRQGIFAILPALAAAIPIGVVGFIAFTNSSALVDSAQTTGTLDARFGFWTDRLAVDRSSFEWLMGGFLGPTPVQMDPRFQIEAHNMYIQMLTTVGIVGLVLLLITLGLAFPRFADAQRRTHSVMLIAVIVFGFFYTWPAWSFILLGLSCGYRVQNVIDSGSHRRQLVPKRTTRVSVAA